MLIKDGSPIGQYCALYKNSWDSSFATNRGQYRGNSKYTISFSYASSNATDPAAACKPKA